MEQKSIKKNYIYNTLYKILTLITPMITAPYTSRIFGADGIGVYSYTSTVVAYFVMFAALGTATYGQREIAMNRNNMKKTSIIFWEIELLSVITTMVCFVGWITLILLTDKYSPYYAVLSMTVIAVIFDISWFFGGYEEFKYIVVRDTVVKLIGILVLFIFVKEKNDLLLYIGLIAATGLLGNISMWTYLPKFIVKVNVRELHFKRHFKKTLAYFVPTIAATIYTELDKIMIGAITNNSYENGYYEQTIKLTRMATVIVTSLTTVMGARMSNLFAQNKKDEIIHRLKNSIQYVMILAIPMMFGLMGIAESCVPWFFGSGYEKVTVLLYVYCPLILIIGVSNCIGGQYLTPSGQINKSSKAIITGAIVNLSLNSVMIPFLQSMGAAVASVIAEIIVTVIYVKMSKEYVSWKLLWDCMWKKLVAGLVMFFAVYYIGHTNEPTFIVTAVQAVIGVIIYVVVLFVERDEFFMYYVKLIIHRLRTKIKK